MLTGTGYHPAGAASAESITMVKKYGGEGLKLKAALMDDPESAQGAGERRGPDRQRGGGAGVGGVAMTWSLSRVFVLSLVVTTTIGCAMTAPAVACAIASDPTTRPATQRIVSNKDTLHIHLPGIGGYRNIDRGMLRGLLDGGFDAKIKPYDWTGEDAGLAALVATQRHRAESTRIAKMIADHAARNRGGRITVSARHRRGRHHHVALEQLPSGVQVDTVVFIAPALSPEYDLTRALSHVRDKVYVLYSPYDAAVLGMGTKMLGTVDGVKAEASGKVGFVAAGDGGQVAVRQARADPVSVGVDQAREHRRPHRRDGAAVRQGRARAAAGRGELPAAAPTTTPAEPTKPAEPLSVPPPLPTASTAPAAPAAATIAGASRSRAMTACTITHGQIVPGSA